MYKETSSTAIVGLALFAIIMIPVGIIVNGLMLSYAWNELLIPIFPELPILGQWQAVGLSTFFSLFTMHLATKDTSSKDDTIIRIALRTIVQYALYFLIIWLVSLSY